MFGRRKSSNSASAGASGSVSLAKSGASAVERPPKPGGKNRPTPKRSEADQQRRRQVKPPTDRKAAARATRERARAEREQRRVGLMRGDERYLPARDQGPVKRLVRDVVDARWNVAELFLPVGVLVLLAGTISPTIRAATYLMWVVLVVAMVIDSIVLRYLARRAVMQRLPDASLAGVTSYALLRSTQLRRLRLPPPRLKRGQTY